MSKNSTHVLLAQALPVSNVPLKPHLESPRANMSTPTSGSAPASASASTSTSPSTATAELKKSPESKPIKLRSACNCCFAAKVRCDGNKEGCKRCAEKRLECTYSESMVGKVVGKRRKRPLPDSRLSECKTSPWNVTMGPITMPSPASTHVSELSNKRNCMSNDWTNLISYDDQSPLDFSGCDEQFVHLDLGQEGNLGQTNDQTFIMNTGLPTPSMSPPDMQFLSPSDLEACSQQNLTSTTPHDQTNPAQYAVFPHSARPQSSQAEDDETVCIKLLAHLKRFSSQPRQSLQSTSSLICKTNAAVKRLLRSRTIRTEYTCQLLLTSVMLHLASIYEQVLSTQKQQQQQQQQPQSKSYSDQDFINECYLAENDQEPSSDPTRQDAQATDSSVSVKTYVHESTVLCCSIGDLLKRKPLNGFQTLGRHESSLIEVEMRLKGVLAALP